MTKKKTAGVQFVIDSNFLSDLLESTRRAAIEDFKRAQRQARKAR